MSKKVTARKLPNFDHQGDRKPSGDVMGKPTGTLVYSRRRNRCSPKKPSFFDDLTKSVVVKTEVEEEGEGGRDWRKRKRKRREMGCSELINLGVDSSVLRSLFLPRESRSSRKKCKSSNVGNGIKPQQQRNSSLVWVRMLLAKWLLIPVQFAPKKWAQLKFDGDPKRFIGLQCKVYWPMDDAWYSGFIVGYNVETYRHHVRYKDGDEEDLILVNERIRNFISPKEMKCLKLSYGVHSSDTDRLDIDEMVVFAASLDDGHDLDPGDTVWAKISDSTTPMQIGLRIIYANQIIKLAMINVRGCVFHGHDYLFPAES